MINIMLAWVTAEFIPRQIQGHPWCEDTVAALLTNMYRDIHAGSEEAKVILLRFSACVVAYVINIILAWVTAGFIRKAIYGMMTICNMNLS